MNGLKSWILALGLLGDAVAAQQVTGQDLDKILERADKLLEEAKVTYEEARTKSSVPAFVDAGFKLEDARIKYIVLQEIGSPEKQKIAGDRLRSVNQLGKLIHEGKLAIMGTPDRPPSPKGADPAKPAPPKEPAPAPPRKKPVDVTKRLPLPDDAKQRDAEKLIRELFKDRYAKKSPADRKALARFLLEQVPKNEDDLASVWVLCREAQDLALQAGDLTTAMAAIDAASGIFDVDVVAMRSAALLSAGKTAKSPEEFGQLASFSLRVIDELVATDQYETADKVAVSAVGHARKAANVPLFLQVSKKAGEVAEVRSLFQGMKKNLEILAKDPNDPTANLEMGTFLCFVKGNWDSGLRYLVKGGDADLKGLAEKELSNVASAAELAAIGDAWRDLAAKEKSALRKEQMLAHAGLLRTNLERTPGTEAVPKAKEPASKPGEALAPIPSGPVNLLALVSLEKDVVAGGWKFEGPELITGSAKYSRIQLPYAPPQEYDLVIDIEHVQGEHSLVLGMVWAGVQFTITCDAWAGDITGLDLLDGKSANENETTLQKQLFPTGKRLEAVCSVRKDRLTFTVDGAKAIDFQGNPRRLTLWKDWSVSRTDTLFLGNHEGSFRVRKLTLVEVTGKGRKIR